MRNIDPDHVDRNQEGTLADKVETRVSLKCVACLRIGEIELGPVIRKLGGNYPWRRFLRRLRCTKCNAKGSTWPYIQEGKAVAFRPRDER